MARYASIKFNKSAIVRTAHELRTAAIKRGVGNEKVWSFGECLRKAWAYAKQSAHAARQGAWEDSSPYLILELLPVIERQRDYYDECLAIQHRIYGKGQQAAAE